MELLLENQNRRKVDILFRLSVDVQAVPLKKLAQELEISIQTLQSTIDEINQEAEDFNQEARIERVSKHAVLLKANHNFSVFQFKFEYIQDSILYQILDKSFRHTYTCIQETADFYHMSVASLYRKLGVLKDILQAYDLEFESQSFSPINGNEKQIRFFFYHFYWYTYTHTGWPFDEALKEKCTSIYHEIAKKQVSVQNPMMKEKLILWLAINLTRQNFNHILESQEVSEIIRLLEDDPYYKNLHKIFNRALKKQGYTLGSPAHALIYFMTICDEDFQLEIDSNFFTLMQNKRTFYEEKTILFMKTFLNFLNRPLKSTEYHVLYKNLLKINMRAQFFTERIDFFTADRRFDYIQKNYTYLNPLFEQFYLELSQQGKTFQYLKDEPHLYQHYLVLLVSHLDINSFHATLNIAFLLEKSELSSLYKKKIDSLTVSIINFTTEVTPETDLVITPTPYILDEAINYFILPIPATPWEWELLRTELEAIQHRKF